MTSTSAALTASIVNPLSWSASLRHNVRAPRGAVRERVERWLTFHGWTCARGAWFDPLDGAGWPVEHAIKLQATREAQLELEPRGWRLTGGTRHGATWGTVWEVRHCDRAGYLSCAAALKREGLLFPAPASRTCARLVLLRGGLSA